MKINELVLHRKMNFSYTPRYDISPYWIFGYVTRIDDTEAIIYFEDCELPGLAGNEHSFSLDDLSRLVPDIDDFIDIGNIE